MKKMKRYLSFLFGILILTGLVACDKKPIEKDIYEGYTELLSDPDFKCGFSVSATGKGNDAGGRAKMDYNGTILEEPYWDVGQHQCNKSLKNGDEIKEGDYYIYTDSKIPEDVSKRLKINTKTGEISLNADTSKDYLAPRKNGEGWVHLLLQQGFGASENLLSSMSELILDFQFTLTKMENMMEEGTFNPGLHAAQFQLFFVLHSMNSMDSGTTLWFGMPFYDVRDRELQGPGGGFDIGTNSYITNMGNKAYMSEIAEVGKRVNIKHDLIPEIKSALDRAKALGYFVNSSFEDLYLVNMNVGWEIPGTFDVGVDIHDFKLKAKLK